MSYIQQAQSCADEAVDTTTGSQAQKALLRLADTCAAIAQAEAAERQAAALERIAAVLESLVSAAGNLKVEKP